MNPESPSPITFKNAISKLSEHFKMQQIAKELKITKGPKGKETGDGGILRKLLVGNLKTYKGDTPETLRNKLLKIEKFSRLLENNPVSEAENFDLYFLFYYWSHANTIKFALLGIDTTRVSRGKFFYLERGASGSYFIQSTLNVKQFDHLKSDTIDIVLASQKHKGATFISAHLGVKEITELGIASASYCGAMGTDQFPYAGIGILQRVSSLIECKTIIQEIEKNGFPPSIINRLYNKRFDVTFPENEVYNNIIDVNTDNKDPLNLLKGYWLGYYLRKSIMSIDKSPRIAKIIMAVEESGIATIYFKESEQINKGGHIEYKGFLKFPIVKHVAVTVGEFEMRNNVHRIQILLKPNYGKLEGIISGWRTHDLGYFTSPVFFEKIAELDNTKKEHLNEILKTHQPARYEIKDNKFKIELAELKRIQNLTFEVVL